jgi:integrase/recombinase XerD
MPKTSDVRRHWRLLSAWPMIDREKWLKGTEQPHRLDIPRYGQNLSSASLATVERAYGRYLNWLDISGQLFPDADPASRVSPTLVAGFLRELGEMAYSGQSRLLLLSGLRCAMRILVPDNDWRWITRPNGQSVLHLLQEPRAVLVVPESKHLYRWGLELIQRSARIPRHKYSLTTYRDGMIIALLAARPVRARTLAALEVGRQLRRTDDGWRLVLEPEDMKNRRALEFNLPSSLIEPMNHYVDVVWPQLATSTTGNSLWIASHGRPMAKTAVGLMIRRRAKEDFGVEFGPHRFRHASATSASIENSDSPALASSLLAIGHTMVLKHYDRASEALAGQQLQHALATERGRLKLLAQEIFAHLPQNRNRSG